MESCCEYKLRCCVHFQMRHLCAQRVFFCNAMQHFPRGTAKQRIQATSFSLYVYFYQVTDTWLRIEKHWCDSFERPLILQITDSFCVDRKASCFIQVIYVPCGFGHICAHDWSIIALFRYIRQIPCTLDGGCNDETTYTWVCCDTGELIGKLSYQV